MSAVVFTVLCKAEPQGSKKGFVVTDKWTGKPRAVVVDNNKATMRSFRSQVTREAVHALAQASLPRPMAAHHVPVELTIEFMFLKPDSCKKRGWPVVKPDIDKLCRSVLDSMTGVIFADDAQVVKILLEKVYGPIERVHISAREITEAYVPDVEASNYDTGLF